MEKILFRPITEGLGFHPFSDGLPYAPISKSQTQSLPIKPNYIPKKVSESNHVNPTISVPISKSRNPPLGFGYLIKRFFAYSFDIMISSILGLMLIAALMWEQNSNSDLIFNFSVLIIMVGFLGIFNWIFITFQEVLFQTSLGKRIFGLMLPGRHCKILLRAFCFLTSLAFFGIGIFWSLFDREKNCLHDRITGITVREIDHL